MQTTVLEMAQKAKAAARQLGALDTASKNGALLAMADALLASSAPIVCANAADLSAARESGMSDTLLDRLSLDEARIRSMAEGLQHVAALPDPVGQVLSGERLANGLEMQRVRVPLGVIGVIYESRPNVTADAAGLCLKAGNAVILRGGSEAIRSNTLLARLLAEAGEQAGLPTNALQCIETTDRDAATALMRADGLVDLLIPRGGERLKKSILANATVPVLASLGGNCHTYVDAGADLAMAAEIAFNAKVSRPSVCNAMETLLVHVSAAGALLPALCARLAAAGIELRGDDRVRTLFPAAKIASDADWETEFLSPILAIRVVDSLDMALDHIARYGTGHSEAIVTANYAASERFVREVDAACVYVNASTRFTDGSEFGMGAEVGISTSKLHARGPVGLRELTTYKTILRGNGQVRN